MLKKRGKQFTPISITLRKGTAVLTGANMGGKSVALKTLTLNVMLFHMGFYVFAEKATLPMFDFVHLISEDLQSVDKGLSTFAAEIVKLQQISNDLARGFSFVALDEFARGTNPSEGAGLARAVARYLNGKNAVSILTTHYDNVSSPEFTNYQVIGLKNIDMDLLKQKILLAGVKSFALISEHMDYRLQESAEDSDPPKDAINICRLLNLSDDILKHYYRITECS
jgi:dsDNA-specific endonuclease/ATPase MutS2